MKFFSIQALFIFTILFIGGCIDFDSDSPELITESESEYVSTTEIAELFTPSGIGIVVPAGAVHTDLSITIETPVEMPIPLADGAEFIGQIIRYGPENTFFAVPLQLSLPYGDYEFPENLSVIRYDEDANEWEIIPHAQNTEDKVVIISTLRLGIFSLAYLPKDFSRSQEIDRGGVDFYGIPNESNTHMYMLTIANVVDYKYENQASWYGNPPIGEVLTSIIGNKGAFQCTTVTPPAYGFLQEATYTFIISKQNIPRVCNYSTSCCQDLICPIYTYSIPVTATISEPLYRFGPPYSGEPEGYFSSAGHDDYENWVTIELPPGGEWVEGGPLSWPTPGTVPQELIDIMESLGMPLYSGNTPPDITGTYKMSPNILGSSNIPTDEIGKQYNDIIITFSDVDLEKRSCKVSTVQGSSTTVGEGGYITGKDGKFTIFSEETYTSEGYDLILINAYSGHLVEEGIAELHYSLWMKEDYGDPGNQFIEINQGRVFYDQDKISERQ